MMAATLLPRNDYGRMQRVNHPGENHTNVFEDVDLSIDLLGKKKDAQGLFIRMAKAHFVQMDTHNRKLP
jgi:hypothetical protein